MASQRPTAVAVGSPRSRQRLRPQPDRTQCSLPSSSACRVSLLCCFLVSLQLQTRSGLSQLRRPLRRRSEPQLPQPTRLQPQLPQPIPLQLLRRQTRSQRLLHRACSVRRHSWGNRPPTRSRFLRLRRPAQTRLLLPLLQTLSLPQQLRTPSLPVSFLFAGHLTAPCTDAERFFVPRFLAAAERPRYSTCSCAGDTQRIISVPFLITAWRHTAVAVLSSFPASALKQPRLQ